MGLAVHTPPNPVILFNGIILASSSEDINAGTAFSKIEIFAFNQAGQLNIEYPNSGSQTPLIDYGMATCRLTTADAFILIHDINGASQTSALMQENTIRLTASVDSDVLVLGYK
jgi:hypothetical protein